MATTTTDIINGQVVSGGDGRCKRDECGRPLPIGERGRSRQFCSDECRIRYYNAKRGQPAPASPPPGDGPLAMLSRLSQLLAEAGAAASQASALVAATDPGRVSAVLADAEAARRRAEAHAATASAQAAESAESAATAWEAADAADTARQTAENRAREAAEQARELEAQASQATTEAQQAAAERDAALAQARAAGELAAAARARAERAEAALDAEQAERRALTDKLSSVAFAARPARAANATRT